MPFLTDDGRPLDELQLAQRPADGYLFVVRAGFVYDDPVTGRRYIVQPRAIAREPEPVGSNAVRATVSEPRVHGITDLASVPMSLWSFVASYGRQSAPAILHDERSVDAAELGDRRAAREQRLEDDRVFRTALREQRVPLLRAWLMWAWVSADREREFGGAAGVLLIAQIVLGGLLVLGAAVAAFWQPAWLALVLIPAIAAVPWRGLAPLVLLLTFSVPVLGPLVALHLVALAPFRVIEAIIELVTGGDPAGVVRPTVRGGGEGRRRRA